MSYECVVNVYAPAMATHTHNIQEIEAGFGLHYQPELQGKICTAASANLLTQFVVPFGDDSI